MKAESQGSAWLTEGGASLANSQSRVAGGGTMLAEAHPSRVLPKMARGSPSLAWSPIAWSTLARGSVTLGNARLVAWSTLVPGSPAVASVLLEAR
ncbi:hypothetical protein NL676_024897 [Syzygium grande]|nr:hypothetical protein NL676_024897 [Syzygium grande]